MTQVDKIKVASHAPIGGSEDEAKEAVKRLFRKSSTPKYDTRKTKELNLNYEADLNRLAFLLDGDFEGTLNDDEAIELSYLVKSFKDAPVPPLSELIYITPSFENKKERNYYSDLVEDLKMFENFNTDNQEVIKTNKEFIISIREELQGLRDNFYNKFNASLELEELF